MKNLFVLAFLSSASLMACAKPEVDCTVFSEQQNSLYVLPYEIGTSYKIYATTEHYRASNNGVGLYAIDFVMPIGTKIVAARDGVVVSVRESFVDGNNIDLQENYVFIQHQDGSVARYFHLTHDGALVEEGDTVNAGDVIALSGNTGQSGGPHLHFDVQQCGPNLPPHYNQLPCGQTKPITFKNTRPHQCGLKSGETYRANSSDSLLN